VERAGLAANPTTTTGQVDVRIGHLEDEEQLLSGKVDEQYHTKVESASKYRARLSGVVLFNLLSNHTACSPTDFVQSTAIAADPREESPDDSCLLSIQLKSGLSSALAHRVMAVSEWSTGHGIQRSVPCCMLLTTATPLHLFGSFIFGNDAMHSRSAKVGCHQV
jgi:hypothetical protein